MLQVSHFKQQRIVEALVGHMRGNECGSHGLEQFRKIPGIFTSGKLIPYAPMDAD
jgi:hypothetical protein